MAKKKKNLIQQMGAQLSNTDPGEGTISFNPLVNAKRGVSEAGQFAGSIGGDVAHLFSNIFGGGGGGGGSSIPAGTNPTTTPNQDAAQTLNTPIEQLLTQGSDPLGIQLLWSKTIEPYLQQLNAQSQQETQQYGQQMNQALQNPMPAYAKQILSASIPQQQAAMSSENNALQGMTLAAPMYNNYISNLTNTQAASRLLQNELAKAITYGALPGLTSQATGGSTTANAGFTPAQLAQLGLLSGT